MTKKLLNWKGCSETKTKAALCYRQSVITNLIYISKLSQGLFYITTIAIMQDFKNNEKKQLKMTTSRLFWILLLRNLLWVILV